MEKITREELLKAKIPGEETEFKWRQDSVDFVVETAF